MPTFGRITEFTKDMNWEDYVEQVTNFFGANSITDETKKRQIFLTSVGSDIFHLMKTLVAPAKLDTKRVSELTQLVQNHLNPKPSVIVSRFKFNSRNRTAGESISDYVVQLRKLAGKCEYGRTLNDMLRDRLVCGVNDDNIQVKLLAERDTMTFENALELALAMESAKQNARDIAVTETPKIHSMKETPQGYSRKVKNSSHQTKPLGKCFSCGGPHLRHTCKFRDAECHKCHRKGHISKVCGVNLSEKSTTPKKQSKAHRVTEDEVQETEDASECYEFTIREKTRNEPIMVTVDVNDAPVTMEVDSGAAVSIIDEPTYEKFFKTVQLRDTPIRLNSYTGKINILGQCDVVVKYKGQTAHVPLIVVKGQGPALLGRNWLRYIRLDWPNLLSVREAVNVKDITHEFPELFTEEMGKFTGPPVRLSVNENVKPVFCKARPVPYSLKGKIEEAIDKNIRDGIWKPIQYSEWAAPIVPVQKPDGSVRLCGDYKVTVNQACQVDKYPLPTVNEVFSKLSGGKTFTKIDLSQAYSQITVHEDFQKYLTVNTHKGLFAVTRLPFGISSAPGIFQRLMNCILGDIQGVAVYLDDILITGKNEAEHGATVRKVLEKLHEAGLKVKLSKCEFNSPCITYLGHRIDSQGIHPTDAKIQAIQKVQKPSNVSELKTFLGLVNYYAKFIPHLSSTLAPLYKLTQKEQPWKWGKAEENAMREVQNALSTDTVLVHYTESLPLLLECDASPVGVGAVLSHRFQDGTERPIAYASRCLTSAEKNYAQIDREGLALVFGVKKFHQYLYGRSFELVTDHAPLTSLLSAQKQVPTLASARIQRWALMLSAYQYTIVHKKGSKNGNADALSRLPLPVTSDGVVQPAEMIFCMQLLDDSPVTSKEIRLATQRDPILAKIYQWTMNGWPNENPGEEFKSYFKRKDEISVTDGILTWGMRVIVPRRIQEDVLKILHETHIGMSRMKALARNYVWWTDIDSDIENVVRRCVNCQSNLNAPPQAPLHPWEWPAKPWSRIHIDHAGPFYGSQFLVLIDSHSKWMEVEKVPNTASEPTIRSLQRIFATHGLPDTIVTDNGTAFTSDQFIKFCRQNGIRHVRSAPRHPSTNGLAERAVQTFKTAVRKMDSGIPIDFRVLKFLARYRITPQTTTGRAPAELLLRRVPKIHLDLLRGDVEARVEKNQDRQCKDDANRQGTSSRTFNIGDDIFTHCDPVGARRITWIPGVIRRVTGPLSFEIELRGRGMVKRHVDQIRKRWCDLPDVPNVPDIPTTTRSAVIPPPTEITEQELPSLATPPSDIEPVATPEPPATTVEPEDLQTATSGSDDLSDTPAPTPLRRSTRERKKPDRYIESY